jgi:hypothetical protein
MTSSSLQFKVEARNYRKEVELIFSEAHRPQPAPDERFEPLETVLAINVIRLSHEQGKIDSD